MAKANLARRSQPRIVVVGPRAKQIARKAGGYALAKARDEKHTMAAVLASLVLGYLDKSGFDIPTVPGLGRAGTLGVAAFAAAKFTNSKTARHVATGMLSVAAYQLASKGEIAGD